MPTRYKRVLIVAYYFPPAGGPAVQRLLRFLRNLEQFNWRATVLTVRDGDFQALDETLLQTVPASTDVQRTYIPEPYKLYRRFTGSSSAEGLDLSVLASDGSQNQSFRERFSFFIRNWLFIPDPRIAWLPFAVLRGRRLIRQQKIDLIFSSAPPNSVHLIAYLLQKFTGRKWVADFRDPWFKYLAPQRKGVLVRKLDLGLAKLVMKKADHLIWVCPGVRKEMMRLPGAPAVKGESVVSNGFDKSIFEHDNVTRTDKFRIVYVGSLYIKYDLSAFIAALSREYRASQALQKDLELVFCGRVDENVTKSLRNSVFASNIKFLGYLPHAETVSQMLSAHVLLLYIIDSEHGKNIPTSKLFEYLGAKRRVLALAPEDSDAAFILRETKTGVIVPPADPEAIQDAINGLYRDWRSGAGAAIAADSPEVAAYEIQHLTTKLTGIWARLAVENDDGK